MSSVSAWRSGDFLIDAARRRIERAGVPVEIEERALDLVLLLLASSDRVLDKDDVVRALWGTRPVTDAALSQCVRRARQALGDDGERQQVIRTRYARGFQWVAEAVALDAAELAAASATEAPPATVAAAPDTPPSPVPASAVPRSPRRPYRWLAVATFAVAVLFGAGYLLRSDRPSGQTDDAAAMDTTAPTPNPLRFAVLPTWNATGSEELDWVAAGASALTQALIADHAGAEAVPPARWAELGVAAASAERAARVAEISGADIVVQPELERIGSMLRLRARIDGTRARDARIELHGNDAGALAVDLAARIVQSVGLKPLPTLSGSDAAELDPFLRETLSRALQAANESRFDVAERLLQSCLDQRPGWQRARYELAIVARERGDIARAETLGREVLERARADGDVRMQERVIAHLGVTAWRAGRMEDAEALMRQALASALTRGGSGDVAAHRTNLGLALGGRSLYREAVEQHTLAAQQFEAIGDRAGAGRALNNLGIAYWYLGELGPARDAYQRSLDSARRLGLRKEEAIQLNNLANIEAAQDRDEEAIALYRTALTLREGLDDRSGMASTHANLADLLARRDLATARMHAEAAQAMAQQTGSKDLIARAAASAAIVAELGDDPVRALALRRAATDAYRAIGNDAKTVEMLLGLTALELAAGEARNAEAAADEAMAIAEKQSTPLLRARAWRARARVEAAGGDMQQATAAFERARGFARDATRDSLVQSIAIEHANWLVSTGRPELARRVIEGVELPESEIALRELLASAAGS